MKNNQTSISILIGIIALGAGFFGGMQYQKMQRVSLGNGTFNRQFGEQAGNGNMARGGMTGGRPVLGEIISTDDKSVTVKMQDGSTKIVLIPGTTSINKAAQGTKEDLVGGMTIAVFGTENSDGTLTAQNIQLNPQMRMKGPTSSASPSPTK